MKKKIINGILVTAMLFAASTSFVSCKDSLSDEVANSFEQVNNDMKALQSRIDDLTGKLSTLEGAVSQNTQEIANLKTQLASLQGQLDDLKNQVNTNTANIAANAAAIEELKGRVDALEATVKSLLDEINSLVVGATVRATIDPVMGAINLPGYNPLFLAAYAGENSNAIEKFPVAGDDFNADPDGHVVNKNEIAGDVISLTENHPDFLMSDEGNAGTIYFTLNPIGLDASKLKFDLVNSVGQASPITITDVKQSSHILTPSLGKTDGGVEADEASAYLYEGKVTIPFAASYDLAWDKVVSNTMLFNNLSEDFSYLFARLQKAKNNGLEGQVTPITNDVIKILQDFYNAWFKNMTAKQYQYLRVTYADGNGIERVITSPEEIITAVSSPLNFHDFYMMKEFILDANGDSKLGFDLGALEYAVGKVVQKLPNLNKNDFQITINTTNPSGGMDLSGINIKVTVSGSDYTYDSANSQWKDKDGNVVTALGGTNTDATLAADELINEIAKALGGGVDVTDLQNQIDKYVDKALTKYNAVKTDLAGLVQRAQDALNRRVNIIITELGGNPAYQAVAPIVLTDTQEEGITLLKSGSTLTAKEPVTFILTSPTQEYLVPAFKKYVAVLNGNKVVAPQVLDGAQQTVTIDLPEGECELIYSVVDFRGYTVTKRYPLTVKKK